jgi:hypothetical protein
VALEAKGQGLSVKKRKEISLKEKENTLETS